MKAQNTPSRPKVLTIVVASLTALILLFHLITVQVRTTETVVITTFGKPTRSLTEPGLFWKLPYPFQDYFRFDARIHLFSGKMEQTYTQDDKNVIVETFCGWKVADPEKFLSRSGTDKNAQKSLEALIRTYTNSVLAKHPFSHLVSHNINNLKLEAIENEIRHLLNYGEENAQQGVEESLGIQIELFGIKKLELPESTTKEVFARMREERNRLVQDYKSQGEGEAKKIKAQANAEKERIIIEAKAQATIIRSQGDAAAAEYYKVYEQNKELAIWLRKLKSLEKLLEQNKKLTLVLDTHTSPFDLLNPNKYAPILAPKCEQKLVESKNAQQKIDETKVKKIKVDEAQVDETKIDEAQVDETKVDKAQADETKIDKAQVDETKIDKAQVDETKIDKAQVDETKIDKAQVDETQVDEAKIDETKVDETQVDETKIDDIKEEQPNEEENK